MHSRSSAGRRPARVVVVLLACVLLAALAVLGGQLIGPPSGGAVDEDGVATASRADPAIASSSSDPARTALPLPGRSHSKNEVRGEVVFVDGRPAIGSTVVLVSADGERQAICGHTGSFSFARVDTDRAVTVTASYQHVVSQRVSITTDNMAAVRLVLPDQFFPIALHLSEQVDCTVIGVVKGQAGVPLFARVDHQTQLGAEALLPAGGYLFHARGGLYDFEVQIPRAEVQVVHLRNTLISGPTVLDVSVPSPETSQMATLNVLDAVSGHHIDDVVVRHLAGEALISGGSPLSLRLSALESIVEVRAMGYSPLVPREKTVKIVGHEATVAMSPAGMGKAWVQASACAGYPDGSAVSVRHKIMGMRKWVDDPELRVGEEPVLWTLPEGRYIFECSREGESVLRASATLHAQQVCNIKFGPLPDVPHVNSEATLTIRGLPAWACENITVCGARRERQAVLLQGGGVTVPIRPDTKYLEIGGESHLYVTGLQGDVEWRIGQGVSAAGPPHGVAVRVVPVAMAKASKAVLVARGALAAFIDASDLSGVGVAIVRHGDDHIIRGAHSEAIAGTALDMVWMDGSPVSGLVTLLVSAGAQSAFVADFDLTRTRLVRVPPCPMDWILRVATGTEYRECGLGPNDGWSGAMVVR